MLILDLIGRKEKRSGTQCAGDCADTTAAGGGSDNVWPTRYLYNSLIQGFDPPRSLSFSAKGDTDKLNYESGGIITAIRVINIKKRERTWWRIIQELGLDLALCTK